MEDNTIPEVSAEIPVEETQPAVEQLQSKIAELEAEIAELKQYKSENEEANQKLIDVIDEFPVLGAIIADGTKGISPRAAIAKHYSPEDFTAEEDDPDYEQVKTAHEERMARKAENESFMAELQQNIQDSQAQIESFAEENGMDEEATASFLGNVTQVLQDAYKGKITKDFLARMYTAENHEKEVQAAAENAMIEGKNMAIEEKIAKEDEEKAGSTLPAITNTTAADIPQKPKPKNAAARFLEGTGIGGA